MRLGEIRWVEFPAGEGRAQSGRRPAVIVQSETASQAVPTVVVVPLTTQQDALRFPGTVYISKTEDNGLRQSSVALAFQIRAVDQRCISNRLGSVSDSELERIWEALDSLMDRPGAGEG